MIAVPASSSSSLTVADPTGGKSPSVDADSTSFEQMRLIPCSDVPRAECGSGSQLHVRYVLSSIHAATSRAAGLASMLMSFAVFRLRGTGGNCQAKNECALHEAPAPVSTSLSGLIFQPKPGQFFTYSQIQNAYNRAFEAAGLPYRSTHVIRHGGTRKTYDETGGDLEIAKQQLGNAALSSVLTYAKRSARAFTRYVDGQWDQFDSSLVVTGRNGNLALKIVKENQ